MNDPLIFISTLVTMAVLGNLLLALWVYADAKAKGLKTNICILLFIFTLANSIGFVIYIIFRNSIEQKGSDVICSHCHARISNDVKYCPYCGVPHTQIEMSLPKKPKKYLLITGILLLCIVLIIAFVQILSHQSFDSSRSLSTTMSSSTKWGNTWTMRFVTANGTGCHTFVAKNSDYGLIYTSNITEGDLKIDFCDHNGNLITEILPNSSDTLRNVIHGEKYKIVVTANKARGFFSFKMRDLE